MKGSGLITRSNTYLPSLTMAGNITLAAYHIVGTNFLLRDGGATNHLLLRNAADSAYAKLYAAVVEVSENLTGPLNSSLIYGSSDGAVLNAYGTNVGTFLFQAFKTAQVEVGCLQGNASDPFFGLGVAGAGIKVTNGNLVGFFTATPVGQQTGVAAQKVNYATPELDTEAEIITAFNTTNAAINTLRTAINALGLTTVV